MSGCKPGLSKRPVVESFARLKVNSDCLVQGVAAGRNKRGYRKRREEKRLEGTRRDEKRKREEKRREAKRIKEKTREDRRQSGHKRRRSRMRRERPGTASESRITPKGKGVADKQR